MRTQDRGTYKWGQWFFKEVLFKTSTQRQRHTVTAPEHPAVTKLISGHDDILIILEVKLTKGKSGEQTR